LLRKLQQRLNELIATHYPDERKRPGYARLAKEIREVTGGAISGTYLWELATGKKRNVTLEQLDNLASFFGVPPEYFLNDDVAARVNTQLALASALRDARVRNLAMRADGLSPASLDALLTMVNEARKIQQLPSPDSGQDVRATDAGPPRDGSPGPGDGSPGPGDGSPGPGDGSRGPGDAGGSRPQRDAGGFRDPGRRPGTAGDADAHGTGTTS
jgi:transcriptional regulator with XRE-family HTH domain